MSFRILVFHTRLICDRGGTWNTKFPDFFTELCFFKDEFGFHDQQISAALRAEKKTQNSPIKLTEDHNLVSQNNFRIFTLKSYPPGGI